MTWIIQDWTGKRLFGGETFASFEEGWERIYAEFPNPVDEDFYGEFYVVELKEGT